MRPETIATFADTAEEQRGCGSYNVDVDDDTIQPAGFGIRAAGQLIDYVPLLMRRSLPPELRRPTQLFVFVLLGAVALAVEALVIAHLCSYWLRTAA